MDYTLELIVVPVSDVDRAKAFYVDRMGFTLDVDSSPGPEFRVVQMTPPGSACSITIGKGINRMEPGTLHGLHLCVDDIEAAHAELTSRGVDVSEPFHYAGIRGPRLQGPDPEGRPYSSWASFSDPDGNRWLLQEIKTRLPGRGFSIDVASMTELLREAEEHHGKYEPTAAKHHWSGWYAAYVVARVQGKTREEAASTAALHVERGSR